MLKTLGIISVLSIYVQTNLRRCEIGCLWFSCGSIYAFAHEIIVIIVDQKLIYPIQFQSL
jgi:hypothetical protein